MKYFDRPPIRDSKKKKIQS